MQTTLPLTFPAGSPASPLGRAAAGVRRPAVGSHRGKATEGISMSDNIYSVSEIVGSSAEGVDDAIKVAISRASKTLTTSTGSRSAASAAGSKTISAATSRSR